MNIREYLSKEGQKLDEKIDLSAGTMGWNSKAKAKAKEFPDFIDATIGSARNNDGSLSILPTLMKEFVNLSGDQLFSYANFRGLPDFVQIWKKDTLETYPANLVSTADSLSALPITSCGLTGGLFIAAQVFFDVDDSILAPNSRWGNTDNVLFKNLHLKGIDYELLDKEGNLKLTNLVEKIKLHEKSEKKIGIYLNFPNNPSGISPSYEQVKILQETLRDVSIPTIILIDDAYEGYIYEENALNHSIFPYLIGLNENVIVAKVDGVSKRYCAYGARLGTVTIGFGNEVEDEVKTHVRELGSKIARSTTSSSPRGIQEAIVNVLSDETKKNHIQKEKKTVFELLKNRYMMMKKLTQERESQILYPANFNSGFFSYFLLKDNYSALEISYELLDKGLGTVPFVNKSNGLNGIRVAFCSIKDEDIERTVDILYSVH